MHILIILWKKTAKRLYFLEVLKRSGLTSDHLLHFYVAVIRSILEYCSPVWNHNLPQYLSDKIESIQKRAIRIICSATWGMPYIFVLSYAELTSLQQRRQTLAKELFAEICKPTSCLHYLLPPARDPTLLTRLRNPRKYPTPDRRTKNTSLLLILLSSTVSKTMLWQSAIVSIARTWNFVNTLFCMYMSFLSLYYRVF